MEKGLLLDVGRKFWAIEQLYRVIDLLSELKMTHLQLHFSESFGFRLECTSYPKITSKEHYTKAEIIQLLAYAKEKNVQIIPDLDSPGHLKQILKNYPDFSLIDKNEKKNLEALDVSNPFAQAFLFEIYEEFAQLFSSCTYFHIGADEFIDFSKIDNYPNLIFKTKEVFGEDASGIEFYVRYVNSLADLLKKHGLKTRVWNDGFFRKNLNSKVALDKEIQVSYWTNWEQNMASVYKWLEEGYELLNYCDNDLYYVLGEMAGYSYPTKEKLSDFKKEKFSGNQYLTTEEMKQVKGIYFSVWADKPDAKKIEEILEELKDLLPVFVEKL
ncbi:MAG: family 20 glycosylhydrolase [Streptococcaceae bacterium]|nr:family 20 glycosylhydrolase [Streptococcaceae bacterium]